MTSFCLSASALIFLTLSSSISGKPTSSNENVVDEMDLSGLESSEDQSESFIRSRFIDDEEVEIQNAEYGNFHQGDMILEPDQIEAMYRNESEQTKIEERTGFLSTSYRWPKNSEGKVIVPVKIQFSDARRKNMIIEGMGQIMKATCIQFVYRTTESDYIELKKTNTGCNSYVGKQGGAQRLSLDDGCFLIGSIIHELIHALGYTHMHNHIDRDKYVRIYWNNVEPEMVHNFKKVNPNAYGNFGTNYDYYSLMHYEPDAFGKNGRNTMVPLKYPGKYMKIIGQRSKMSKGDVKRLNNMYKCNK